MSLKNVTLRKCGPVFRGALWSMCFFNRSHRGAILTPESGGSCEAATGLRFSFPSFFPQVQYYYFYFFEPINSANVSNGLKQPRKTAFPKSNFWTCGKEAKLS